MPQGYALAKGEDQMSAPCERTAPAVIAQLLIALARCAVILAGVSVVIGIDRALTKLAERPGLPSHCPGLIETYQATGVPVHIQIKCGAYL